MSATGGGAPPALRRWLAVGVAGALLAGSAAYLARRGLDDGATPAGATGPALPPVGMVVSLERAGGGDLAAALGPPLAFHVGVVGTEPIVAVELWSGGTVVDRVVAGDGDERTGRADRLTWRPAEEGAATLVARAIDGGGRVGQSNPVRVEVAEPMALATYETHVAVEGETLDGLAEVLGHDGTVLVALNPGMDPTAALVPGTEVLVPTAITAADVPASLAGTLPPDAPAEVVAAAREADAGAVGRGRGLAPPPGRWRRPRARPPAPGPRARRGPRALGRPRRLRRGGDRGAPGRGGGHQPHPAAPRARRERFRAGGRARDGRPGRAGHRHRRPAVGRDAHARRRGRRRRGPHGLVAARRRRGGGGCEGWEGDARLVDGRLVADADPGADLAYLYLSAEPYLSSDPGRWVRVPPTGFVPRAADGRYDFRPHLPDLDGRSLQLRAWGRRGGALVPVGTGRYTPPPGHTSLPPSIFGSVVRLDWIEQEAKAGAPEKLAALGTVEELGVERFRWSTKLLGVTHGVWQVTAAPVAPGAGPDPGACSSPARSPAAEAPSPWTSASSSTRPPPEGGAPPRRSPPRPAPRP
ncbi:MAG: hypothetical protein M5U14_20150 [Acidimicrobiia bacterium]|nr:hypothetical protein [Acidimicrobiia bacterium]